MAARKKTTTRKKPHYVRAKKRKGADSALVAQRSVVIGIAVCLLVGMVVGIVMGFQWIHRKLYATASSPLEGVIGSDHDARS